MSVDGLEELAIGKSLGCHIMVWGCLAEVREIALGEEVVFLGLHSKDGFQY